LQRPTDIPARPGGGRPRNFLMIFAVLVNIKNSRSKITKTCPLESNLGSLTSGGQPGRPGRPPGCVTTADGPGHTVRHEARCRIAHAVGRDWRRSLDLMANPYSVRETGTAAPS